AEKDQPAPAPQQTLRRFALGEDPDEQPERNDRERDDRDPQDGPEHALDHVCLACGYSSAAGNERTSAMSFAPVSSISRRSTPTATPPAWGIPASALRNRSSSGNTSRPS